MSLTISLRVPDGLVIAADSLASIRGLMKLATDVTAKCPKCQQEIELEKLPLPPIQAPASTRSFAQKLFPFWQRQYGVASYGSGILTGKTIYYHARELERELQKKKVEIKGVTEAANIIGKRFAELVGKEVGEVEKLPKDALVVGFQVVGYDGKVGKTVLVKIGKETVVESYDKPGCTTGGDIQLVQKIWEMGKIDRPVIYDVFSLQDAIDYAQFLIETTARYQRFTSSIPSVGGEVDIALVTVYSRFKWIQQKEIQKILEGQE